MSFSLSFGLLALLKKSSFDSKLTALKVNLIGEKTTKNDSCWKPLLPISKRELSDKHLGMRTIVAGHFVLMVGVYPGDAGNRRSVIVSLPKSNGADRCVTAMFAGLGNGGSL